MCVCVLGGGGGGGGDEEMAKVSYFHRGQRIRPKATAASLAVLRDDGTLTKGA